VTPPSSRRTIGVLHGPNLGLLGEREPAVYGAGTLGEVDQALGDLAEVLGARVVAFQSNHEGALVDWLHATRTEVEGYVVNAAGLTHTSVVLRDALLATGRPFVEVHLSNTAAREPFRHTSLLADRAAGVVYGFGAESYLLGLRGLLVRLDREG
jgi:3-dehydroquinate dehydratase-2